MFNEFQTSDFDQHITGNKHTTPVCPNVFMHLVQHELIYRSDNINFCAEGLRVALIVHVALRPSYWLASWFYYE